MTLLQDEQEKPQSKAGPTRHAKIMRGIVTPIFGLLAVACIAFTRICDGVYDDVPEQAFSGIGGIDDLEKKWHDMQKEYGA